MKRFLETLPAAILLLFLLTIATLDFFGFPWAVPMTQTVIVATSWVVGLVVLGLCLFGPFVLAFRYIAARIRGRR